MTLVADRFVETPGGRVIDLATGADVVLTMSSAGGPTDQLRWAARCDWFQRLFQPALARLLDYGPIGETRRFEAWQCGLSQSGGSAKDASRTACSAAAFLRACCLTASENGAAMRVADTADRDSPARLVAIPGAEDGYTCEAPVSLERGFPLENCGIVCVERRAVAAAAELFEVHGAVPLQAQVLCLWGPEGSGKTTALLDLARIARRNGFVPISARLLDRPLARSARAAPRSSSMTTGRRGAADLSTRRFARRRRMSSCSPRAKIRPAHRARGWSGWRRPRWPRRSGLRTWPSTVAFAGLRSALTACRGDSCGNS